MSRRVRRLRLRSSIAAMSSCDTRTQCATINTCPCSGLGVNGTVCTVSLPASLARGPPMRFAAVPCDEAAARCQRAGEAPVGIKAFDFGLAMKFS